MTNRSKFLAALLLTAGLATALPAAAASLSVPSGDLNLGSDAGRAILRQRIALAVERVCDRSRARTAEESAAYGACRKAALASAAPQTDALIAAARDGEKIAAGRSSAKTLQ